MFINITKKMLKVCYLFGVAVLILVAATITASTLNIPQGFKLFTVQSGSMAPSVPAGAVVLARPQDNYKRGDIITFAKGNGIKSQKSTTTHRVVSTRKEGDTIQYQTKGDRNKTNDPQPIVKKQIIGKVIFALPFVGHPVSYAKTLQGFIVLIIIPSTIIVYSEILNIKKELLRMFRRRRLTLYDLMIEQSML